jgi:CRISPR/Cas system endoribonuclease Cas6 (RAMP superfamily)
MINQDMLNYYFKNKNYNFCISILNNEIIETLVKRIKKENPNYQYNSIIDLKINCFSYLSETEQKIASQLETFSLEEYPEEYELNILLNIYKKLK